MCTYLKAVKARSCWERSWMRKISLTLNRRKLGFKIDHIQIMSKIRIRFSLSVKDPLLPEKYLNSSTAELRYFVSVTCECHSTAVWHCSYKISLQLVYNKPCHRKGLFTLKCSHLEFARPIKNKFSFYSRLVCMIPKGLFTHSVPPPSSLHCVNSDRPPDGQNGFKTHSAC